MLIAIDGPAGAGKSTVARALAERLGFAYLDTGAMYRCVGLLALEHPEHPPAALAGAARIEFALGARTGEGCIEGERIEERRIGEGCIEGGRIEDAPTRLRVLLDRRDVSDAIRAPSVSAAASRVAGDPGVRAALVARQRELVAHGDWVAEGRDIATAVAPDADLKVYLTADPAERARRRAAELGGAQATVLAEQALRDQRDSTLGRSTLVPAPGAVVLDTTGITIGQAVERVAELAREAPTRA
jgi:CMP/dCMP kinase